MLYDAACYRAICAAVIPHDPKIPAADAARLAQEQADLAMAWLHKAVAAGFKDVEHMKQDKDLDALRESERTSRSCWPSCKQRRSEGQARWFDPHVNARAAGGVLTAKQAPRRPGTAPALGLRAGSDVAPFYRRPPERENDHVIPQLAA